MTNEQITTATGLGVVGSGPDEAVELGPLESCIWTLDGDNVVGITTNTSSEAQAIFDAGKEGTEPVTGVGTDANWNAALDVLQVIEGDSFYPIQVLVDPEERNRPVAETLAREVLANAS